jgi:two-component sensor histidine kinase
VADEMRHRLRNNYVIVGSLLRAYSKGKPEQSFAREMIDRLNGLGIAQTMKAEGSNTCLLHDLVPALLEPYATPDCALNINELPDVHLDQAQVDTLALVLGELAVNSTKHGALSASGSVQISGTRVDDRIELMWLERSDRKVTNHSREGGQGFALMERVLASHAGGIKLSWAEHGLDVKVHLSAA